MVYLPEEIVSEYEQNGVVCLRQVFSPEWIEKVKNGIEKNLQNPSSFSEKLRQESDQGVYFNDYFNWRNIPEFREFVNNSPVAKIVQHLMQSSSVTFYHEHVLVKEAGALKKTPWHQDQSYYPFNGDQACSVWMPVDPIFSQTTLKFVRGSHKLGWFYPRKFATSLNYALLKPDVGISQTTAFRDAPSDEELKNMVILEWCMEPGDCLVFHIKTLHGADGNSTPIPRRILSTRWFGDDVFMTNRPWNTSPPYIGQLKEGDHPSKDSDLFPVIIHNDQSAMI